MADNRPDIAGGAPGPPGTRGPSGLEAATRLRREVIVPVTPPHRPRVLVALSVALVLLAGALDALMWRHGRQPPPARVIRVDVNERLDRLELRQRLDRLGQGHGRARAAPTHPSQIIGSPPF